MTFLTELERLNAAATEDKSCFYDMNKFIRNHASALAELVQAANDVIARWDTPSWKDSEPTAHVVNTMRKALAALYKEKK